MRKMRRVSMKPSPSAYPIAGNKYDSLLQAYQDLAKDTESQRRRLQEEKQKKQILLGQVKFLRRKLENFHANQSNQHTKHPRKPQSQKAVRLARKNQPRKQLPVSANQQKDQNFQDAFASEERNSKVTAIAIRDRPLIIDLNQTFVPIVEEKDFQLATDSTADLKPSVSRNGIAKRKVSWKDQVSLKI